MGTSFEEIYASFLMRIRSYDFVTLSDEKIEEELLYWLKTSVGQFYLCQQPIQDTDFESGYFNVELTGLEQEIIVGRMLYDFLSPYVYDVDSFNQSLNSREYRVYSEANLLEAKAKARERLAKDINKNTSAYQSQLVSGKSMGGFFNGK